MPKDLKDFPRPPSDNGRGLHGSLDAAWTGGNKGYAYWVKELAEMGVKWFKVLDDGGNTISFCEKLLAAGIFPIVRVIRRDPPPNDSPEPNPGHIGASEEKTIRRLIDVGVRYFETSNEPNVPTEWKHNAMPSDPLEAAKIVVLNWLFDARFILSAGGYPGLPAISNGGSMDLMSALVALGRGEQTLGGGVRDFEVIVVEVERRVGGLQGAYGSIDGLGQDAEGSELRRGFELRGRGDHLGIHIACPSG